MKLFLSVSSLWTLTLILAAPTMAEEPLPKPSSHTKRNIEGFTVHIDDRLLAKENEILGGRTMKLVEAHLGKIALIVPEKRVAQLRKVHIYVDLTHGQLFPAQYHPSPEWLKENGYPEELAKCVHIPNAKDFADPVMQRCQPWVMMHELAHAYHDQVLGFENKEIEAAYQSFVKSGKYKSVLHFNGELTSHYALTDVQEFFAEMTETYIGQNDFYPFNGAELKKEEPELYKLMTKIWGKMP